MFAIRNVPGIQCSGMDPYQAIKVLPAREGGKSKRKSDWKSNEIIVEIIFVFSTKKIEE
jgi:hypothetical protein